MLGEFNRINVLVVLKSHSVVLSVLRVGNQGFTQKLKEGEKHIYMNQGG